MFIVVGLGYLCSMFPGERRTHLHIFMSRGWRVAVVIQFHSRIIFNAFVMGRTMICGASPKC